jgi:hypothetical protein
MTLWIAVAGMLASLAVAEPAHATPRVSGPSASLSDTDRAPSVHPAGARSERWDCSRAVCRRAAAGSSWSAGLGFAATALAAAAVSRRRSSAIP